MSNLGSIDHVAYEVADLDGRVAELVEHAGMTLLREGRLVRDPSRRIAMVGDGHGFKLELVESPDTDQHTDRVLHVAWRCADADDVATAFGELVAAGAAPLTAPGRFEPARSWTATVLLTGGATVQLVAYDDDSPDRGNR